MNNPNSISFLLKLKKKAPPTESEKEEAEKLKLEGNDLMRTEQFEGAIEKYTKYVNVYEILINKMCCHLNHLKKSLKKIKSLKSSISGQLN